MKNSPLSCAAKRYANLRSTFANFVCVAVQLCLIAVPFFFEAKAYAAIQFRNNLRQLEAREQLDAIASEINVLTTPSFQRAFPEPLQLEFGYQGSYPATLLPGIFPPLSFSDNCETLLARPTKDFLQPIYSHSAFFAFGKIIGFRLHPALHALLQDPEALDQPLCAHSTTPSVDDHRAQFDKFLFLTSLLLHGLHLKYFAESEPYAREPRLRHYQEFFHVPIQFSTHAHDTSGTKRFPLEAQELESRAEQFAVLGKRFWMENNFACRRPAVHRLFLSLFPEQKNFGHQCFANRDIRTDDTSDSINLNVNKVFTIVYVDSVPEMGVLGSLTSSEHDLTSAFGHSLLRVITCESENPEQQGMNCAHDAEPDLYISFEGASLARNGADGKTGGNDAWDGFASQLVAYVTLGNYSAREKWSVDRGDRYGFYEFRRVNKNDLQLLLDLSMELHDHYAGVWHHYANNCSVHLMRLLRASMQEDPLAGHPALKEDRLLLTPEKFLRFLQSTNSLFGPLPLPLTDNPTIQIRPR